MEKEKLRNEIDTKYQWDLTKMYLDNKAIEDELEKLSCKLNTVVSYKEKIMESPDSLYNFYQSYDQMNRILENLYVYSHMKCDEDTKNVISQSLKTKIERENEIIEERTSFIVSEMLKTPYHTVQTYIQKNPKLEEYAFQLKKIYRYQNHILSEKEEEIVAIASTATGAVKDVFYNLNNADIQYDKIIDENGNLVALTNANYLQFMNCHNRDIRKSAFESMYRFWASIKNTVAATLKGKIKEDFFFSKVHRFNSPLEQSLYSDNIPKEVYLNLINIVHKNLNSMYQYMDVRKKILGLDELHMYDIYVDLIQEQDVHIPFEKGKEIIFESLKPLGEQYLNDLKKAFDENWIDIYPNIGKKSGAYSWGTFDSYPYVLLNYNNTIDSVSTMGHELGHSMHSYYSIQNQKYINHSYPIFLAEIASTVNEVLINDYLYHNAKSKEEKILYLTEFLDKVRTTIYRQTMFAEFEMIMHDKEANGVPLTEEEFSNTYYQLNKLYYGDNVISDDLIRYEWEKIPHFYTPFYVYKYATGLSAAITIAMNILEEKPGAKENYLEFLSSGGSDDSLEILKKTGVDMTKPDSIQKAFDIFEQKLKELMQLSDV